MRYRLGVYALVALAPASLLVAKVITDYDHHSDFSRNHTYSWIKVAAQDSLWNNRIKRAIDAQLADKGWQQVPSGADADVTAIGATHNQQSLDTLYTGFGGGWRWRGFGNTGMATTTVRNIPVGRWIVDIFDGNSKQLVWRGIATDTLTGNPEKNEKKLGKSVTEMFKKFPPPSKG